MKPNKIFFFLIVLIFPQLLSAQLLWEISGNNLSEKSYLYGTIHIQDKRVFNFGDVFYEKFNSCKAYAMEILMEKQDIQKTLSSMMLENDMTIKELLNKQDYKILDSVFIEKTGFGISIFNNIKPFWLMSQLSVSQLNKDISLPMDLFLKEKAEKKGNKILAIEKFEDQINAINSLTIKEQCKMLMNSVKNNHENSTDDLINNYLAADLDKISEISENDDMPKKFQQVFIIERNKKMAEKIAEYCKKQSTFNAIGAAHLAGKEGVIKLLRQKGFTVEAIDMKSK